MKASAKTEAAVTAMFEKFLEAYRKRDIDDFMRLVAPDDDVVLYGTGADEKRVGREQFKFQAERDWSQTDSLAFRFVWQHISEAGPVAWVAADGVGQGQVDGAEFTFPFRATAVLEQRQGKWYFVQMHMSLASAGQEEGDSVPV
jgi:ketosteroid isomerase-like protein